MIPTGGDSFFHEPLQDLPRMCGRAFTFFPLLHLVGSFSSTLSECPSGTVMYKRAYRKGQECRQLARTRNESDDRFRKLKKNHVLFIEVEMEHTGASQRSDKRFNSVLSLQLGYHKQLLLTQENKKN